ncbi:MAG: tRNA (adenosine(37)-N6)-threonylcarbamoyltransferase complex ATPase subunit type 1 TsaE [Deltaproteobacteria bacterium]|nr:MAG: tRNA (adenosine(37)-N6)-threonylcarbamoyltransferase complex ATPase subunit type 1 TsaE [Deltaproteobacteria bacterium]
MRTFTCPLPEDTEALGQRLGEVVPPGTVVALRGDLGAGKTVFARGVGRGLGITTRVQSPTFVIVQWHEGGRLPFAHADLYRLGSEDELEELGLDELFDEGLLLVEWAHRFPDALPADHAVVVIEEDGEGRIVHVDGHGPRSRALVEAL